VSYLVDTNVLSELRKGRRANAGVRRWFDDTSDEDLFVSVLVIGEIRRGVERIRVRDAQAAGALEGWLICLTADWSDRILPVTREIAEAWGRICVPHPLPAVDSLMAATAHVHGLVLVTRNTRDIARTGVAHLDPFS
jgi:predicted nucleic acid-binding protein